MTNLARRGREGRTNHGAFIGAGKILGLLLVLAASSAVAGSIFLNGVQIDGAKAQRFENATVVLDDQGNVHIQAAGYAVAAPADKSAGSATGVTTPVATGSDKAPGVLPMTRRYWLVKEENFPGKVQYDVDVYFNGSWFKRIRSSEEQVVIEISKQLQSGENLIHLAAVKNIGQQRKSFSPQAYMRIIIGEGEVRGTNVVIENPLVQYTRTANELKNFHDEFTLLAR